MRPRSSTGPASVLYDYVHGCQPAENKAVPALRWVRVGTASLGLPGARRSLALLGIAFPFEWTPPEARGLWARLRYPAIRRLAPLGEGVSPAIPRVACNSLRKQWLGTCPDFLDG